MSWIAQEWHKIAIAITMATQWLIHWEDIVERLKELTGLKTYIERRIGDRRNSMNFVSGLLLAETEAVKVSAFMAKLPTYLPLIQKNIADLQKAATDRSNPAALMTDVSALLTDLNSDLALLATVAPALSTTTPIAQTPAA